MPVPPLPQYVGLIRHINPLALPQIGEAGDGSGEPDRVSSLLKNDFLARKN
jgi:hypothetical protein